mmetsp:Transcript_1355/g.3238  ORF Transcript_1355/g.3238 Transcript_1355/m.3238 type:complete len:225 (+) Transcript_1355:1416-2090(+)
MEDQAHPRCGLQCPTHPSTPLRQRPLALLRPQLCTCSECSHGGEALWSMSGATRCQQRQSAVQGTHGCVTMHRQRWQYNGPRRQQGQCPRAIGSATAQQVVRPSTGSPARVKPLDLTSRTVALLRHVSQRRCLPLPRTGISSSACTHATAQQTPTIQWGPPPSSSPRVGTGPTLRSTSGGRGGGVTLWWPMRQTGLRASGCGWRASRWRRGCASSRQVRQVCME